LRVLAGFKRRAAATRLVVDSVIEGSLREQMSGARDEAITEPLDFPSVGTGGVAPGVDPPSNAPLACYVDTVDGAYERVTVLAGDVAGGSQSDVNETVPAAATHGTPRERRR